MVTQGLSQIKAAIIKAQTVTQSALDKVEKMQINTGNESRLEMLAARYDIIAQVLDSLQETLDLMDRVE